MRLPPRLRPPTPQGEITAAPPRYPTCGEKRERGAGKGRKRRKEKTKEGKWEKEEKIEKKKTCGDLSPEAPTILLSLNFET